MRRHACLSPSLGSLGDVCIEKVLTASDPTGTGQAIVTHPMQTLSAYYSHNDTANSMVDSSLSSFLYKQ